MRETKRLLSPFFIESDFCLFSFSRRAIHYQKTTMNILDLEDTKLDSISEKGKLIGGMSSETYAYTGATYSYAGTDAETGMAIAYADAMGIGDYVSITSDTASYLNNHIALSAATANTVAVFNDNFYWSQSDSNSMHISTGFRQSSLGYSVSTGGMRRA